MLATFMLYSGGDSGELVAEGCILGTAHPPGYPLLTMMVYALKQYLPLSLEEYPVAYRVNALRCDTLLSL